MSQTQRILAFAGSTRADSSNRKLVRVAVHAAVAAHNSVTWIDLKDYPLPLFDADLEAQALPEPLLRLRALLVDADALILASPEYNGFFTPLMKNTLDWLSRPVLGHERHAVFAGLPVLLLSAVGGRSGGPAGLRQLRQQLLHLTALPHEKEFVLPLAATAFDVQGRLSDPQQNAALADVVAGFSDALREVAELAAYA